MKNIKGKSHCVQCKDTGGPLNKLTKSKHGVQYFICRACNTERLRKYRATKRGGERTRLAVQRSIKKHKVKQKARVLLNYHVKVGNIVKQNCPCGSSLVEAHHPDYSKPLAVVWLCRACHSDKHSSHLHKG